MKQNNKDNIKDTTRVKKNKRIFIIVVSMLISLVLIFGIVIGTVTLVRDRAALVKYGGSYCDEGTAHYLAATYKSTFMSEIGESYDTPEFWQSKPSGIDKTYGEILEERTLEYIKGVIAGAYLFDRYSSLSSEDRDALEAACREVLDYKAGGNESVFNDECARMGFGYADFCKATELIYKSELAKQVIYGKNGASLEANERYDECNIYYNNQFSHVKILYIPTREKLLLDSGGKLELGSDGKYLTNYYSAAEIIDRQADISNIRRLIEGYSDNLDEQMSPDYFDSMQEKYNISQEFLDTGYYFSPYSTYTARFAADSSELLPDGYREAFYKMLSAVIESSFTMSHGQYHEIEGDYGVVFIYKYENEPEAYLDSRCASQFHDFFSDAADYLYSETLRAITPDVSVREGYYEIDVCALPYNYKYIATVG